MDNTEKTNHSAFICPICGKTFDNVHTYAEHMCNHSIEEKNIKAEEEKKQREEQKQRDLNAVKLLKKEYEEAYKRYSDAKVAYDKKYNINEIYVDDFNEIAKNIARAFSRSVF